MTATVDRTALTRRVHFHDPYAPTATVVVTGLIGLFTYPGHVVRAADGEVRQQFAVLFRARAVGGEPHADAHEASEAAWVAVADLPSSRPSASGSPKRSPPTPPPTLADPPRTRIVARLNRTRERVEASQLGHVQRRLVQADLVHQALILAALGFSLLVPVLVTLAALVPLGSAESLPAGSPRASA